MIQLIRRFHFLLGRLPINDLNRLSILAEIHQRTDNEVTAFF
ncbi:hypothetical protein PMIT1342_01154 [Prochlorococcus marinus str. MIT 1342]|nr:hypothetical protein PMIT1342_01154 [Prochlorococcus marinus str. MIT 1342]